MITIRTEALAALALALFLPLVLLSGCHQYWVNSADRDGLIIQKEGASKLKEFRNSHLLQPLPKEEVELEVGEDEAGDSQEEQFPVPGQPEVPKILRLEKAIAIATQYNRDFIARRENFFLAALGLGLVRSDFNDWRFSSSLSYNLNDGSSLPFSDSSALSFAMERLFWTGARISLNAQGSLSTTDRDGRAQSAALSTGISLTQPLLRGFGHDLAYEGLTQAERSFIYDVRSFELFRQQFAIGIIDQYYAIVSQKIQLKNNSSNIERAKFTLDRATALNKLGRGTQLDVFRAEQSYLNAKTAELDSIQSYQLSLDRFKIELGLSINTQFDVADDEFPELKILDYDLKSAVAAALNNRLDLASSRQQHQDTMRRLAIAKNNLLPDLNLSVSYNNSADPKRDFRGPSFHSGTVAAGLSLEIPLERESQRNSYRSALIRADQSKRSLKQTEDQIILEVRDAVRALRQQLQQIRIEKENIKSLSRSVIKARLDNEAGQGTNRDIVEAQDRLTDAENALLDRLVSYEIRRLNLLRQLGILFVNEEGQIIK